MSDRPILSVHAGDFHSSSEVALCAPGTQLDDGRRVSLNPVQAWLWPQWLALWDRVTEVRDAHGARVWGVFGGEAVEGIHHGNTQLVTPKRIDQMLIARANFEPYRDLRPERSWWVAGTEAHAGRAGEDDKSFAEWLGCERNPATGRHAFWRLRVRQHTTVTDIAHHAWGAYRPWTKGGNALRMAAALTYENYDTPPEDRPRLAVRHHIHNWNDSFDAHPVRVITVGGWKLSDAFIHRINPIGSEPAVGALLVLHWPDGRMEVEKFKRYPDPDPIMEAA